MLDENFPVISRLLLLVVRSRHFGEPFGDLPAAHEVHESEERHCRKGEMKKPLRGGIRREAKKREDSW